MPRWPGGVIRKTPVAPSGGTASGVWSMAEVAYWKKLNLWPTLPGAPTIGTATAGASSASVTFTAPTNTGTPSTITQYRVTSSPGAITATGASSPITVTGLTNGTSYTFTVAATNAAGTGPESASSNAVTPVDPNYMAVLKDASISLYNTGGNVDSSGNLYSVGFADTAGDDPIILTKYDASGALLFQYAYTRSGYSFNNARCGVSSTGDIYIWAIGNFMTPTLIKLNSSGVVQWAYETGVSSLSVSSLNVTSGDIYGGCFGSNGAHLFSFTTSGTLNWARRFSQSNASGNLAGALLAPNGDLYVGGHYSAGGATTYGFIARLTTGGTNVWLRGATSNGRDIVQSVAVDTSNNIYIGWYYEANPGYSAIHVFDSSYSGVASAYTASSGDYPYLVGLQVDASNNVYAYASQNFLFKLNSSLTQQFQRRVSGTSQSFNYGSMNVLNNRIYVTANNDNASVSRYNFFAMKVPDDGTSTGTRTVAGVNYSYASSTVYSWSAGGTPGTFSGVSQSTVSATLTSRTITRTTPTYTQTVTTF